MLTHDDSVLQVKDRQPLLTPEDCVLAEDIAKADPEVAAMVKEAYGITDLSLLACDPWSGELLTSLPRLRPLVRWAPTLNLAPEAVLWMLACLELRSMGRCLHSTSADCSLQAVDFCRLCYSFSQCLTCEFLFMHSG